MKLKITALAATLMAGLTLALPGSPGSAAPGPDTLTLVSSSTSPYPPYTGSYDDGQELMILLNIDEGDNDVFQASLETDKSGSFQPIAGQTNKTTNKYGRYVFTYAPTGNQNLRASWTENGTTHYSETLALTPVALPPPDTNGTLAPLTGTGKTATAHFNNPTPGAATKLQIQRIPTVETDEVNPTNPEAATKDWTGPWITIATSTQNATGDTTFSLPSPYPYRVEHNYRAVSVSTTTPPVKFGLGQVTPKDSGLSALYFNTNEGASVNTRTHYFEGEFAMSSGTPGCSDVGVADPTKRLKNSVMKGRGNYSWSFPRKSFTLKIGKSTDLCGMGKSKKYALVSDDYDKSLLRNALAGYIGDKIMGAVWTPDSVPVDLYVNGSYRGNYRLIERIAIDPLKINIDELNGDDPTEQVDPGVTGGYVLEWDFRKGADYNVNLGSDSGYVGVKEPENDYSREGSKSGPGTLTNKGISSAQKTYINGYLNSADNALRGSSCQSSSWTDYIDQDSAVNYYIAMEYMKPVDGNMWASVYMYKPRNGKIFFGPLWDFDLAAGSANRAGNVVSPSSFYLRNNLGVSAQQSSNTWFNCLNKRSSFRALVKARWNAVKGSLTSGAGDGGIPQFLDDQKALIATSAAQTYSVFGHGTRISQYQVIKSDWNGDVSYLKSWANSRTSWLSGGSGF